MLKRIYQRLAGGRTMILLVAGVVLGAVFLGLHFLTQPKRIADTDPRADREFEVSVEDSRRMVGFVESYGRKIDDANRQLANREEELKALRDRQKKYESILETILQQLSHAKSKTDFKTRVERRESVIASPARIARIKLKVEDDSSKAGAFVHIPAGSFGEATLLNGVYAPTEGSALPVLLRLDAALVGPNRSRVPIQDAFLIGKAVGDPNSRRIVVQLEKLSYVGANGRSVEIDVNGYVTDSDGVMGIGGKYVWRARETIALAALSGATSAAAGALAQGEVLSQLNPVGGIARVLTGDGLKFAAASGGSRAADEIQKILAKRVEQVVPAIYAPNGKSVTISFIEGATLEGLAIEEAKNESSRNRFVGLDVNR